MAEITLQDQVPLIRHTPIKIQKNEEVVDMKGPLILSVYGKHLAITNYISRLAVMAEIEGLQDWQVSQEAAFDDFSQLTESLKNSI